MKSLLLLALGLARTVVLGARIEAERIVVSVRPYKREQRRCPVCGRACDFYDMANRGAPRLWRAMDLARSACYLEYAPCRVRCPEHGVRTEAVPWVFFTTTIFRISRLISFGFHRFAKVPHPFFANCPIFPSSRLPRTFCSARRTQPADHDA